MNETKLLGCYMQLCQQLLFRSTFVVLGKTIKRLRRRFHVTGNVADPPRSGRQRVTTAADKLYIVFQHLSNRRLTAAATGRQYGIHPQTVRNRAPIRVYQPYVCQILTGCHQMQRRDWCGRHLHFLRADWDLTFFSDECRFNLSHAEGRERIYCHL